jgi:general secretion pathway protein J
MNGFTLVETLVALLIFGLLAAAGVVILGNSADAQIRLAQVSDAIQDMQRARAALRADLAQAANRTVRGESGAREAAFVSGGGDGRLFAFVRRGWENPDGAPRASLQYVEYRLEDGRLERRARAMLDGARLGPPAVLAENIESIEVAYRVGADWRPDWDAMRADALPPAVRLDMTTHRFGIVRQLFLTSAAQ